MQVLKVILVSWKECASSFQGAARHIFPAGSDVITLFLSKNALFAPHPVSAWLVTLFFLKYWSDRLYRCTTVFLYEFSLQLYWLKKNRKKISDGPGGSKVICPILHVTFLHSDLDPFFSANTGLFENLNIPWYCFFNDLSRKTSLNQIKKLLWTVHRGQRSKVIFGEIRVF